MKQAKRSILAFDDSETDLATLSSACPDVLCCKTNSSSGESPDVALDAALRRLADVHPDVIVLDLRWHSSGMSFEGITFLQEASDRELLQNVVLVIWSEYLRDARLQLNKRLESLRAAGIRDIAIFEKPDIPPLDQFT